jgi:hypothetical protein
LIVDWAPLSGWCYWSVASDYEQVGVRTDFIDDLQSACQVFKSYINPKVQT